MPTSSYSSASSASSDGSGSAYSWILDHLLMYPSTYELPLRTMYQLNCSAGAQLVAYQPSPPDTPNLAEAEGGTADATRSPGLAPSQVPGSAMAAASQFRSNLMAHLANLPAQPLSLPPKFITDFVRRCFSENLVTVDFVQALTGMDYLRDLEMRRRREFAGVLKRLGLDGNIASVEGDGRSSSERVLEAWVMEMNSKSRNVESLYSQCYVGLRRWVSVPPSFRASSWTNSKRRLDADQRNVPSTVQRDELHGHAQYPLPSGHHLATNQTSHRRDPARSTSRPLSIYLGGTAERNRSAGEPDAARSSGGKG